MFDGGLEGRQAGARVSVLGFSLGALFHKLFRTFSKIAGFEHANSYYIPYLWYSLIKTSLDSYVTFDRTSNVLKR